MGADQTAWMRKLVSAFVFHRQHGLMVRSSNINIMYIHTASKFVRHIVALWHSITADTAEGTQFMKPTIFVHFENHTR